MNFRIVWLSVVAMIISALLIFQVFQSQFSGGLLNVALDPQLQEELGLSKDDQKRLSEMDPENKAAYRTRFDRIHKIQTHYLILEHNRQEIERRFRYAMVVVLGLILVGGAGFFIWEQRRRERRLSQLQTHLEALSTGSADITVADRGRDTVGRIGRMIEKTSRVILKQRNRLASLESLSAWQEAARRHAHEIRTPLTAARMELNQMARSLEKQAPQLHNEIETFKQSINEELDLLKVFTQKFTSFARIGKPKMQEISPYAILDKFTHFFDDAWENLTLKLEAPDPGFKLLLDREMVRQVLVNLCNNAALAMGEASGNVVFSVFEDGPLGVIEVRDNGPGIAPEIMPRLFRPYNTTRKIGEGMGLGLSICKKIMLDHQGDLILHQTSNEGTCFRLVIPVNMAEMEPGV